MSEKIKYPDQIRVVKRKGKNLSVRFLLGVHDENSGESPLEFPRYSRFVMSILKTEGEMVSVSANIPQEDLPDIVVRTNLAVLKIMDFQTEKKPTVPESTSNAQTASKIPNEAYEATFGFPAELRGKNLVQVVAEGNWNLALGQKATLQSNAEKYPKNKVTIAAIEKIEAMLNMGQLTMDDFKAEKQPSGTATGGEIFGFPVYETEYKYFSKQREDGKNQVYQVSAKCLPGNKYPFVVSIVNAYGSVVTTATGGKNITNVTDKKSLDIYLTESEWVNMINRMERLEGVFETLHGKSRFEIMRKHSWTPDAQGNSAQQPNNRTGNQTQGSGYGGGYPQNNNYYQRPAN